MARSDKKELDEKEIAQLETLAGYGLSIPKIAALFNMSKKTFERRMAENEGKNPIADAISKGRAKISHNVIKAAYEMAVSKKHPSMTIFWLKCRERWKDSVGIDHNMNINLTVDEQDKNL